MKKRFTCPQCQQDTISAKQKYLAGIWRVIYCSNCSARLCTNPIIMAIAYAIYFWLLAWCTFMAHYYSSFEPLIYLVLGWLFLDFLNINLIPLSIMKAKKP